MSDDDKPTNIFQFPGAKGIPIAAIDVTDFKPGAFIDEYGAGVFTTVGQLPDASLAALLYGFRQHRAMADCMVDLLENELDRRNGDLGPVGPPKG